MAYEIQRPDLPHSIILEGRSRLNITGIEDVESFDEQSIVTSTSAGILIIQGEDLHIERLSLDIGELVVEGVVSSLSYEDDTRGRDGLFKRLFR